MIGCSSHQREVNQIQVVNSIVHTQLRIPALATSSIPESALHGQVKELEGRIKLKLKAIYAEHAIFEDPDNIGLLLFNLG